MKTIYAPLETFKFFVVICIAFSMHSGFAMDKEKECKETVCRLPNAKELRQRLGEKGFDYFAQKTKIIDQLADKELCPLGVALVVARAQNNYKKYLDSLMGQWEEKTQEKEKVHLLKLLLQDCPYAIENLECHGLMK